MRNIWNAAKRFIAILSYLIVTFWPHYGVVSQVQRYYFDFPLAFSIFLALWTILFILLFPFPLRTFKLLSALLIAAAIGHAMWMMGSAGWFANQTVLFLSAAGAAAILLFWMMISTPVWRWARFTVVVQGSGDDH